MVVAGNDYFDLWKNDASFSRATSKLFRRTEDYNDYVNIHSSRRTFSALLPHIRRTEKTKIKEIICQEQLDELATQIAKNTLTEANELLLDKVRDLAAHFAMQMAIPHLSVLVQGDGIKVTSSTDSMEAVGNVLSAFGKEAVGRLIDRLEEDGKTAEKELYGFLYAGGDIYPLWKGSE